MSLDQALKAINDQQGKGTIGRLTDEPQPVPVIPSGILGLDLALGGGFGRGRITELSGLEGAGKSTLVLQVIAHCQAQGMTCAYIDAEHEFDEEYAVALGVNLKKLLFSQPDHMEQALEVAHALVRSGGVDLVVIDSVAALSPKVELEGEVSDQTVGLMPRILGKALRMMKPLLGEGNTTLILVNQIRMQVGVMLGSPEITPGGKAMKFFPSQRIDLRRVANISKSDGEVTGIKVKVLVKKNKIGPPFKKTDLDLDFGKGFSREGSLIDQAIKAGTLAKATYLEIGGKKHHGREQAKLFLADNPEVFDELLEQTKEKLNGSR